MFDGTWSDPAVAVEDAALFVNWADFPRLTAADDGGLLLAWSRSLDGGGLRLGLSRAHSAAVAEWERLGSLHEDTPAAEYGFPAVSAAGGTRIAVWLDGRDTAPGGGGLTQLRALEWTAGADRLPARSTLVDDDVCSCCQTAILRAGAETLVAYRDHRAGEIRDIAVVRRGGDGWSVPAIVHDDGWEIAACPVNGPSLAARDDRVALAWFTNALGNPRVKLALSADGGRTFDSPIEMPDDRPLGRVSAAMLDDGTVTVIWLRPGSGPGEGEVVLSGVEPDGTPLPLVRLGRAGTRRDSGFPRSVAVGDTIVAAWTVRGPEALNLVEVRF